MVDITPVQPQAPLPQAKPATAPVTPQTATSLQPALATTAAGTTLSGYIVNRDASGNPILRTPTGDVTFTSNTFLKIGSDVTLAVSNGSNGATQAQLLTVNGQAPNDASVQDASETPDVIIGNTATGTQTAATVGDEAAATPSPSVTGTVLSAATDGASTPLPVGSQLTLKITGINPVPAEPTPGAAVETPTQAASITTAATPPTDAASTPAQYATYARAAGATPDATATDTPATDTTPGTTQPAASGTALPATNADEATAVIQPGAATAASSVEITATAQTGVTPAPATSETIIPPSIAPGGTEPAPAVPAGTNSPALPIATLAPATASATAATAQPAQSAVAASATTLPQPGQAIAATVINTPPTGQTIVQSPIGILQLQPGVALPTGSGITFELTAISQPQLQSLTAGALATSTSVTDLARRWESLQQITTLLNAKPQDTATPYVNTNMPWLSGGVSPTETPDAQPLSTGLMLFISALSGGDFTGWIGKDNAKWLSDEGHDELLKKAETEFTTLARQFSEPEPHHWQPLFFPLMTPGGEMQQVRLFVKRDRKQGSNAEPGKETEDTRFVVEIELSQLGEMQMDGFIRHGQQSTLFDLIIRTNTPLSEEMQQDIYRIYNATGELTGYQGGLVFQAVREFPVNPMDEAVAPVPDVMV